MVIYFSLVPFVYNKILIPNVKIACILCFSVTEYFHTFSFINENHGFDYMALLQATAGSLHNKCHML